MIFVRLTDGLSIEVNMDDVEAFGKEVRRLWKQKQILEVTGSRGSVKYVNPRHIIYWELVNESK